MSTIYLSFAGMIGFVKAENEINVTRNFLPFLEEPQNTDYSFEYISCEKLGNLQGKLLYAGKEYDVIQKENGDIIRVFKDHQEDDCVYGYSKLVPFENTVKIFYLKGNETIAYAIFACYNNVNPYKGGYKNVKSDLMGLPYAFFFFC